MFKPTAAQAKDLQYRSIPLVILLSAATLFIGYPIYLTYQWARELNGLANQTRHSPRLVLIISIVTLGLGAVVYECIFAHELERDMYYRGALDARPQLTIAVVTWNVIAVLGCLTGVGVLLAIPCGMAATCLVQSELNKLCKPVAATAPRAG